MAAFQHQPSAQDIDAFRSIITDVRYEEVIARLRNNNCNVDQAINEYFDDAANPGGSRYSWDEGQFSSNREGTVGNHGFSYNIQGPDAIGPLNYPSFNGAPSRPPSRMSNNKSPLTNVIDLTAEAAAADPNNSKSYMDSVDSEMEQAIAKSLEEAGLPPQESGIISTSQVHFGPANRNEYEQGKWDMVPLGKGSVHEIMLNPEPVNRKRDIDAPAFLKPSVANNRLAALFTIFHEIPIVREIFLDRIDVLSNYGFDKEWWAGTAIDLPAIIGGSLVKGSEVTHELQRLMAFLDKTDRSYGSVEPLSNLAEVKKAHRTTAEDMESAVLDAWRGASKDNQAVINKLFSKGVSSEAADDQAKEFTILDLEFPTKDSEQETLYDVADEVLWPSLGSVELAGSAFLSHIGEVIAFRVSGHEATKSIEIPAVWYPDRYLASGRQAALEMRLKKRDIQGELDRIEKLEGNLTHFQMRNGKTVRVKDLFETSLRHDEGCMEKDGGAVENTDAALLSPKSPSKTSNLSAQLQIVIANIDKKLLALNEEKEKARKAMKNLSKLYTEPSSEPDTPKLHQYSLRGVSTTKSTMYVCRRAEPDLIDMNLDNDDSPSSDDQWWRINYASSGLNPVTVEKTTEENVLEATKNGNKSILLVYASEKAMEFTDESLPSSLVTFTKADNRAFKAELTVENSPPSQLASPGKRKFSDHSRDSEDSVAPGRWTEAVESSMAIMERELGGIGESTFDSARLASQNLASHIGDAVNSPSEPEVIVGVDPAELQLNGRTVTGQEMLERSKMPLSMIGGRAGTFKSSTIDGMDLDEVLEGSKVASESGAVKHVGFAE